MSAHLALVGPTASGKSTLALDVAETLGDVEIVSIDSMQIYRGMDVGTAKPSAEERGRVRHHLIDVADPDEEWSVVRFRERARRTIAEIEARGRRAILVGGTGLYHRAVVDRLEFPPEDRALRAELEAQARVPGGLARLYAELAGADPEAAERIDPGNERRVVRALEVVRLTGRPFSSWGPGLTAYEEPVVPVDVVGVRVPRDALRERIARRLARMRAAGFVDEVAALRDRRGGLSRTARQAIGYRELLDHLAGEIGEDEAFERVEVRTRRFARRQLKWFERDPRVRWLDATAAGEGAAGGDTAENPGDLPSRLLGCWERCAVSA